MSKLLQRIEKGESRTVAHVRLCEPNSSASGCRGGAQIPALVPLPRQRQLLGNCILRARCQPAFCACGQNCQWCNWFSGLTATVQREGELRSQPWYHSRGSGSFSGISHSVPMISHRSTRTSRHHRHHNLPFWSGLKIMCQDISRACDWVSFQKYKSCTRYASGGLIAMYRASCFQNRPIIRLLKGFMKQSHLGRTSWAHPS